MKYRKSFRLSPEICNRLALLSSHYGVSETSIVENSVFIMSVVFEELGRTAPNSQELKNFGCFFDYFGFAVSHFYQGGFHREF